VCGTLRCVAPRQYASVHGGGWCCLVVKQQQILVNKELSRHSRGVNAPLRSSEKSRRAARERRKLQNRDAPSPPAKFPVDAIAVLIRRTESTFE